MFKLISKGTVHMALSLMQVHCFLYHMIRFDKNVHTFGVDNSSAAHKDNRKKEIWVLGFDLTYRLDEILAPGNNVPKVFQSHRKKLHYNGSNNSFLANGTKCIIIREEAVH